MFYKVFYQFGGHRDLPLQIIFNQPNKQNQPNKINETNQTNQINASTHSLIILRLQPEHVCVCPAPFKKFTVGTGFNDLSVFHHNDPVCHVNG